MKIVTAIPAVLANATDIVDRNIVGHVEVLQDTVFPLPSVPDLFRVVGITAPAQRSSFFLSTFQEVNAGVPAGVSETLCTFGRGLWHICWRGFYQADYLDRDVNAGFRVFLGRSGNTALIEHVFAVIGFVKFRGDVWVTLTDDLTQITAFLSTNIAAQNHAASFSLGCEKYL